MFYELQLKFFCDTIKKCHLQVTFISADEDLSQRLDIDLNNLLGNVNKEVTLNSIVGRIEHNVIYRLTDRLMFCYIFFMLPQTQNNTCLVIGPFLSETVSSAKVLEICEKHGIPRKEHPIMEKYYGDVPIIPLNSHLYPLLDTLGEHLWGGADAFSVNDINYEWGSSGTPFDTEKYNKSLDDTVMNMRILQKRYEYENEIMDAVAHGQARKAEILLSGFANMKFEQRLADPVRNIKNYCIIINTLLRKAAEKGGVHPIYLDNISSSFATKIERLNSTAEVMDFMREMFRSYCRLVRKHSMKDYSLPVQKAITCIDTDLSADLSLSTLAKMQNISPGYLSTVFKKETGKTVTEYINQQRVKHATHLLNTTKLQIQTIAQHCGIMDVHYFSKVYKKYTGKTPKEHREMLDK